MQAYEYFIAMLNKAIDKAGSPSRLARALDIAPNMITRWSKGERCPNLKSIQPVFDYLNEEFRTRELAVDKDVHFVNPRLAKAAERLEAPVADDFLAAPVVGEVGAGPGYFDQEQVERWMLADMNHPAIRGRRNLIAVEIGRNSTSMLPLLHPGDMVLVDRDDRDVSYPGSIMLVRDPDGAGMVKRVKMERHPRIGWQIVYFSDNASANPPLIYSLDEDFDGSMENAIVGRVVFAMQDVKNS
jgi:phage repressor protein C with HTH and peptisase S24 domain